MPSRDFSHRPNATLPVRAADELPPPPPRYRDEMGHSPRIHVDRAACAWLIRRFIDPDAEFVFLEDPSDVPDDATPFDIRGATQPP